MRLVRSASALRRLYEAYRAAPSLKTSTRRPGEWLVIQPGSEDGRSFETAFGVAPANENAETVVRELGAINGALGVFHEKDVRIVVQRLATRSRSLEVRFVLVATGKTTKGSKPTPRSDLPAISGQLNLDQLGPQKVDVQQKVDVHANVARPGGTTAPGGGVEDAFDEVGGTPMCLPDGSPLPDLSNLLMPHELVELWSSGKLVDADTLDVLFDDYADLLKDVFAEDDDVDLSSMADRFRARAVLASGTPPIETSEEHPRDTWERVSQHVVSWVKSTVHTLRDADVRGHMLVLAPSPGTGKSRGMMEAADQEQSAKRTVGYAVLSRAQLEETKARLLEHPQVKLIVIEGRHEKNCWNFDKVTVATNAGFSPGSTVCPSCEFYPQPGRSFNRFSKSEDICPYYQTRLDAVQDRRRSDPSRGYMRQTPSIILTTHAAAIQGSHIATRRNQNFWNFDTLFIDEDPTASMVTQHEIREASLTYTQVDHQGNIDGPTRGTLLLREAMKEAVRLREEAAKRGFVHENREPDLVHDRDHGSTFAGGALHALLEAVALASQSLNLRAIGSMTIDGMTQGPRKGEIMNLSADEVAARYPNRYLAPLFAILEDEAVAIAEARAAGTQLEPAYRVHLDLVSEEGAYRPVFRVHELRGYANGKTNIVVGDAYADVVHYEGLFNRFRREGHVQVLKHRATWPTTSTLVRIVTRAGTKELRNTTQLRAHLDASVRPVLELEHGRKVVLYVHKAMKGDLREWIDENQEELGIEEFAIEHWGSGRGKDTYRDFHTFVAVTEYVPNVGALTHEANVVAALAGRDKTRVVHWTRESMKTRGATTFANSLSKANPFYQAAFHRKATDELAQAVHRIRPAMAAPDGRQKRAYVFGHQVPWTDELIAATAATAVVDNGKETVDLETEALGRGVRFSFTETLALLSEREVAGAISEVFKTLGCWAHVFAHSLVSVPSWASVEEVVGGGSSRGVARGVGTDLSLLSGAPPASSLVGRVLLPPNAWTTISDRIRRNSRIYLAGLQRLIAEIPFPVSRHRAPWMATTSNGVEFWGDRDRLDLVLAAYAPNAQKVPF